MIRSPLAYRLVLAISALAFSTSVTVLTVSARSLFFAERNFYALTSDNKLLAFDAHQASVINGTTTITGLQPGESVLAMDIRPSDGRLYGLGSTSRLYIINPNTGAATQVGSGPFTPTLSGSEFGFNFGPSPEIIRIVSDDDQNLRIDADTGMALGVDGSLSYASDDISAGRNPNIVGLDYFTVFERGTARAAFYGIDSERDTLVALVDPAAGTLRTLGPLGVNAPQQVGFASSPSGSLAFALFTPVGERSPRVYEIDLGPPDMTISRANLLGVLPTTATAGSLAVAAQSGTFQFSASAYSVIEDSTSIDITVTRTGDLSRLASIGYFTRTCQPGGPVNCQATVEEAPASSLSDYNDAIGTLIFSPGVASRTISVLINEDAFAEGAGPLGGETLHLVLWNPTGNFFLGSPSEATLTIIDDDSPPPSVNSIDDTDTFVHQHYHDFLNREPEPQGLADWKAILANCNPGDTKCDRIEVSSGFYRSTEFQQRGYFVYRFYSASFGRVPHYAEFLPDMAGVSGFQTEEQEEASKAAFIEAFMSRQEFKDRYDRQTDPRAYVEALETAAGVTLTNRETLIADLAARRITRAQVLRSVVESGEVFQKYYNQAFVVMQYFGYLRRDPDILYLDWIDTLNRTGDYRVLINGFVNSQEYRHRFGQP